jgi:hypothetical protein
MIPAMILAASTVAIVAIAAVVIVALVALIYIVPRGGRRRSLGPFLGMCSGDRFEVSQGESGLLKEGCV